MKIKAVGFAEKILGFYEKEVQLKKKKKLSEIIDFTNIPINLLAIIINEKACTIDHLVDNNDHVIITQIVAGG